MVLSSLPVLGFRSVSLGPYHGAAFLKFNVWFGSAAPLLQILGILGNDVHVHWRRLPQEPMHCRQVKVFAPVPDRRTPENYLRNVFRAHKIRDRVRHAPTFELPAFRPQLLPASH